MQKISNIWRWCLCILLGIGLSYLFACAPPPPQKSGIEIEFWTMQLQPQFTSYFNELISNFEDDNPEINVRWVDVPWEAMESKILTAVSAKTAPDIVNLNPNFASQLAARNAWLTLDERFRQRTNNNTYRKFGKRVPSMVKVSVFPGI